MKTIRIAVMAAALAALLMLAAVPMAIAAPTPFWNMPAPVFTNWSDIPGPLPAPYAALPVPLPMPFDYENYGTIPGPLPMPFVDGHLQVPIPGPWLPE